MIQNYVGGAWREASATDSLAVMNPASGEEIGRVPLSTAADMDAAVQAAKAAFPAWRDTPVTKRIPVPVAVALGGLAELVYRGLRIRGEPPLTRFVARQLSTAHWFDISAARRDLGYKPRVSIDEGLRRLAASFSTGEAATR